MVIPTIRGIYFPGRRIAALTLLLEASPNYAVKPLEALTSLKAALLSAVAQAHPDGRRIRVTAFIDLTDTQARLSDVMEALRRVEGVVRVEGMELPFTHGEAKLITFPLQDVHNLFTNIKLGWGSGGMALLYHIGMAMGSSLMDRLKDLYESNEDALRHALLYVEALGHGLFELSEYRDGSKCVVAAEELFECISPERGAEGSHFFRGMLAGFLSRLWGVDAARIEVEEVRCMGRGDDKCVFEAKLRER